MKFLNFLCIVTATSVLAVPLVNDKLIFRNSHPTIGHPEKRQSNVLYNGNGPSEFPNGFGTEGIYQGNPPANGRPEGYIGGGSSDSGISDAEGIPEYCLFPPDNNVAYNCPQGTE